MKLFAYKNCDRCRSAVRWLDARGVSYQLIPIREEPPSVEELRFALKHSGLPLKSLFNTSGQEYRSMDLKSTLPAMPEDEALRLLASKGNLVKRPLLLGADIVLVGFSPEAWEKAFDQTA